MHYIDCSEDIRGYHDDEVKLPGETRKKLREHRNANQYADQKCKVAVVKRAFF